MMKKTYFAAALALSTMACSANYEADDTRTAIAAFIPDGTLQSGHLILTIANGPLSCPTTSPAFIVEGPGCDSPSWHVQLTIPEPLLDEGNTVAMDTPDLLVQMAQQDVCHSGDPMIESGQLKLVDIRQTEVDVTLQVTTRSSVDPSGTYTAPLCQ